RPGPSRLLARLAAADWPNQPRCAKDGEEFNGFGPTRLEAAELIKRDLSLGHSHGFGQRCLTEPRGDPQRVERFSQGNLAPPEDALSTEHRSLMAGGRGGDDHRLAIAALKLVTVGAVVRQAFTHPLPSETQFLGDFIEAHALVV